MQILEIKTDQDDVVVLQIEGTNLTSAEEIKQFVDTVNGHFGKGTRNFVLDLSEVVVINGEGLYQIEQFWNKTKKSGGSAVFCSLKDKIQLLFALTKKAHFETFATLGEALASFEPKLPNDQPLGNAEQFEEGINVYDLL